MGRRSVEGRNLKQMEPEKHVNLWLIVRSRVMGGTAFCSTALACFVGTCGSRLGEETGGVWVQQPLALQQRPAVSRV